MKPLEIGNVIIKLAETENEIRELHELSREVFCEDAGTPQDSNQLENDLKEARHFDFLIAVDKETNKIIATYRLCLREHAEAYGSFVASEEEFDLTPIRNHAGNVLEFSRAVTHKDYRNSLTMQATWKGIAEYIKFHDVRILFGIPSFHGTNPEHFLQELSYLHHFHLAPKELHCASKQKQTIQYLPKESIDKKEGFASLPPLIKGYLRVGAFIGPDIFVDEDFNTTDVLLIVDFDLISDRYRKHFLGE